METEGLAAVCAGLGHVPQDPSGKQTGKFCKGECCLENLKDLQRFLRRDNPETRDAFKQICKWNVTANALIPIIVHYREESELVLNAVKVLAFLTTPIDPSSNDITLQLEYLWNIKASFSWNDAIAVIVSLLEEPLEHLECDSSREDDWKVIQLVLTLFRNLLAIKDPAPQQATEKSKSQFIFLRDIFLEHLFHENVMDLILALTQHVAGSHGILRQDNLLFLEIFHSIFWGQRPELVATVQNHDPESKVHRSSGVLRSIIEEEEEQRRLSRLKDLPRHSRFSGTFVRLAEDGSKKIIKRNPFITPAEIVLKGNQIKRGPVKRIACDTNVPISSADSVLGLLQKFAYQFLSSGYNVLMQSVREDIRRDHHAVQNSDIVIFFELAQFFTAYQRHWVSIRKAKNGNTEMKQTVGDSNTLFQGLICGPIASTMNEAMFNMVISKWHSSFEALKETNDLKTLTTAGALLKEMIRLLDAIIKMSHDGVKELDHEARTARILLYKLFYDQTEKGVCHLLWILLKSFDNQKQPRSHLADLVEMTHVVLRLMEGLKENDGSLRVLKKSRKSKKKKKGADLYADSSHVDDCSGVDNIADKEGCKAKMTQFCGSNQGKCNTEFQLDASEQVELTSNVNIEDVAARNNPLNSNDETEIEQRNTEEDVGDESENKVDGDSEDDRHVTGIESNLDIHKFVSKFAENSVVQNYCWLLKFYKSNSEATNYYIVRMLQRICDDCMLAPMLYQLSLFSIFYEILSDQKTLQSKEYRNIVKFLTTLLRDFFKKLKDQPLLFMEILFWKSRKECYTISTDDLLSDMKKIKSDSNLSKKRSLADALGEDEAADPNALEGLNGSSKQNLADALGEDEADLVSHEAELNKKSVTNELISSSKRRKSNVFSEEQESQIRELFECYKENRRCSYMIAEALDANGSISAAQVSRKLKQLGLKVVRSRKKQLLIDEANEGDHVPVDDMDGVLENPSFSQVSKWSSRKRRILDSDDDPENDIEPENVTQPNNQLCDSKRLAGSVSSMKNGSSNKRKSLRVSEEQESLIKEIFELNKENKRCSKLIAETVGLSVSQVNYTLRSLGLRVRSKKSTSAIADSSDVHLGSTADGHKDSSADATLANKSSRKEESYKRKRAFQIDEAQETQLKELFERYKEDRKCSRMIAEALGLSLVQVNRRLKILGLKKVSKKSKNKASEISFEKGINTDMHDEDDSDNETLIMKLARSQSTKVKRPTPKEENDRVSKSFYSDQVVNTKIENPVNISADEDDSDMDLLSSKFRRHRKSKTGTEKKGKNHDQTYNSESPINALQSDLLMTSTSDNPTSFSADKDPAIPTNFVRHQAIKPQKAEMEDKDHQTSNSDSLNKLLYSETDKSNVDSDGNISDDEPLMARLNRNKNTGTSPNERIFKLSDDIEVEKNIMTVQ